jgi:hypothetical protein
MTPTRGMAGCCATTRGMQNIAPNIRAAKQRLVIFQEPPHSNSSCGLPTRAEPSAFSTSEG